MMDREITQGEATKKEKKKKIEINTKLVGGHDRKRDRDEEWVVAC